MGIFRVLSLLWVAIATVAASGGILAARRIFATKLQGESSLVHHLAYGSVGSIFAALASIPMLGFWRGLPYRPESGMLAAILVPLFIVDWSGLTSPARDDRISLSSAIWAAILGFICSAIFGGTPSIVVAVLAGTALVVQVVAPFDPTAAKRLKQVKRAAKLRGAAPIKGTPGAPPIYHKPDGAAQAEQHDTESVPPLVRNLPRLVRLLCLLGCVLFSGLGIVFLSSGGMMGLSPEEFVAAISGGIGLLIAAIFCLVKAVQGTYHSWYGTIVKPILLFSCLEVALISSLSMGSVGLRNEEMMVALFFLVFPLLLFVVILALPSSFVHGIWTDAQATPSKVRPTSKRLRLWALLLSFLGAFWICGIHRIYAGKIVTGLIWFFTAGLFFVGQIFDIIMISLGRFTDDQGHVISVWYRDPAAIPAVETTRPVVATPREVGVESKPRTVASDPATSTKAPLRRAARSTSVAGVILNVIGGLLLFVAVLMGMAVAIFLPMIIAAEPSLHRGDAVNWSTLNRLVMGLTSIVMLLAASLLVFARRRSGGAHMIRAIVATVGLALTLSLFMEAFSSVNWDMILSYFQTNRIGLAVEAFANRINESAAAVAAAMFLGSMLVLAWPARRRRAPLARGG